MEGDDLTTYWLDKGNDQIARARRGDLDVELVSDVADWPDPWIAAELLTYPEGTEWELAATAIIDASHALRVSPSGDVAAALRRATEATGDDRIAALEDAWRGCLAPELADAIEALDSQRGVAKMPVAKKKKDTEKLWAAAAETAIPRSLFAGTWPKQWRDAQRRMRPLYRRPRSPLFATAALEFARRDPRPYTSIASQTYWQAHAWFIAEQGDVRQLAALEELERSLMGGTKTVATDALRRLVPRALSDEERELLASLAVPAKRAAPATLSLASPEERAVAADQLLIEGDPRGELIAVQEAIYAGGSTPELLKRQAKLIKKHAKDWVPNTVYRDTCVFRRGVPVAGHLMFRSDVELASMAGSKALATFDTLVMDRTFLMGEVDPSVYSEVVASLPSLRCLITTDQAARGIAAGKPTTIEHLVVEGIRRVDLDGPGLPALVRVDASQIPTGFDRPWNRRLQTIGCWGIAEWQTLWSKRAVPAVVLTHDTDHLHRNYAKPETMWELWVEQPGIATVRHQIGSTAASLQSTLDMMKKKSWKGIDVLRVPTNFAEAVAPYAAKHDLTLERIDPVDPAREGISRELA